MDSYDPAIATVRIGGEENFLGIQYLLIGQVYFEPSCHPSDVGEWRPQPEPHTYVAEHFGLEARQFQVEAAKQLWVGVNESDFHSECGKDGGVFASYCSTSHYQERAGETVKLENPHRVVHIWVIERHSGRKNRMRACGKKDHLGLEGAFLPFVL